MGGLGPKPVKASMPPVLHPRDSPRRRCADATVAGHARQWCVGSNGTPSASQPGSVPPRSMRALRESWQCLHNDCNSPCQNWVVSPLCGRMWSATSAAVTRPSAMHMRHNGSALKCAARLRCQAAVWYGPCLGLRLSITRTRRASARRVNHSDVERRQQESKKARESWCGLASLERRRQARRGPAQTRYTYRRRWRDCNPYTGRLSMSTP